MPTRLVVLFLFLFASLLLLAGCVAPAATPVAVDSGPAGDATPLPPGCQPNHLLGEKSPYLQLHVCDPVEWYPWGEEAFARARAENKPIFVTIGYSACHWCHVMQEENFLDPQIARMMNDAFINVAVDREERPDLDELFQAAAQNIIGNGGWPLNIVMTPDGKPFAAATYIPKKSRGNIMGMEEFITRIGHLWQTQQGRMEAIADSTVAKLKPLPAPGQVQPLGEEDLKAGFQALRRDYDKKYGGFGRFRKFPQPHKLLFLLRYWHRSRDAVALEMVEATLDAMRRGGIFDQIGFGFHRYTTDENWLTPHFEKMLYDQALLTLAYAEAYQATGRQAYADVVRETLTYTQRDLLSPEGAFYASEDADSAGQEGGFYLWTLDQLKALLSPDDVALVEAAWGVTGQGNYIPPGQRQPNGQNILHLTAPLPDLASRLGMTPDALQQRLESIRQTLFNARQQRPHPARDKKILTDWNGLMIAALAQAARALDEPAYAESARTAADFLLSTMQDDQGRLLHRYAGGEAGVQATAADYADLIWGLINLYEATFDLHYLQEAVRLQQEMTDHFWDEQDGGFFNSPDDTDLPIRRKTFADAARPSANSVAALNLLRLSGLTGDIALAQQAEALLDAAALQVRERPDGYAMLLSAVDYDVGPSYEIVIVGPPDDPATQILVNAVFDYYLPNTVVVLRDPADDAIDQTISYVSEHRMMEGKPTAYVCQNFACKLPTTDPEKMLELLGVK